MNFINEIDGITFSLNGVTYYKNFTSKLLGADNIIILNAYDSKNVLVPPTSYEDFTVNNITYNSNEDLHNALLTILYSRANLNGTGQQVFTSDQARAVDLSNTNTSNPIYVRVVEWLNNLNPNLILAPNVSMVLASYYTLNGQNVKQTWNIKRNGQTQVFGEGQPNVGIGILEPREKEVQGNQTPIDFGDLGNTAETPEQFIKNHVNTRDPKISILNGQLITATINGIDYQWNFSGQDGDYGLNGDTALVENFNRYEASGNAEDENNAITKTSQIPINNGEDGTSRYTQDVEILENGKFKASLIPNIAITDVVIATETTLQAFTTNSGNYTFEQGDIIIIDDGSNVSHFLYKGGDKTDVNSYSQISATEFAISQVQGLQAILDNSVKKVGVATQKIEGTIIHQGEADDIPLEIHLKGDQLNGLKILSDATQSTSRPGIVQYALRQDNGGLAFNLIDSYVGTSEATALNGGKIGVFATPASTVKYMFLDARFDGNFSGATLKIDRQDMVGISLPTSQRPTEKLEVNGNVLADKFITKTGDGTNLIDDQGNLYPKSNISDLSLRSASRTANVRSAYPTADIYYRSRHSAWSFSGNIGTNLVDPTNSDSFDNVDQGEFNSTNYFMFNSYKCKVESFSIFIGESTFNGTDLKVLIFATSPTNDASSQTSNIIKIHEATYAYSDGTSRAFITADLPSVEIPKDYGITYWIAPIGGTATEINYAFTMNIKEVL